MKSRSSGMKIVAGAVVLALLIALLWRGTARPRAIAALQQGLPAGSGVWFDFNPYDNPDHLPAWLDAAMNRSVQWAFPAQHFNYQMRLRSIFAPPITTVWINGSPGAETGRLLPRFPALESVELSDDSGPASEAELRELCAGARQCEHLRIMELRSDMLTDAAIAPLSGHPSIERLVLRKRHITPASVPVFASMPKLGRIQLERLRPHDATATQEEINAFQKALPGVLVYFTSRDITPARRVKRVLAPPPPGRAPAPKPRPRI